MASNSHIIHQSTKLYPKCETLNANLLNKKKKTKTKKTKQKDSKLPNLCDIVLFHMPRTSRLIIDYEHVRAYKTFEHIEA